MTIPSVNVVMVSGTNPQSRNMYEYLSTRVLVGDVIIRVVFYYLRTCAVLFLGTTVEFTWHYMQL